MNSKTLKEHRCSCGKLLFRGIIVSGVIEIKCRRCACIKTFRDPHANPMRRAFSFVFSVDHRGRVADVSNDIVVVGYDREEIIGRMFWEFFPLARDISTIENRMLEGVPYHLPNNVLILRDQRKIPVESYFVPMGQKSEYPHYCMLNIARGALM